jgi:hypothetical protein
MHARGSTRSGKPYERIGDRRRGKAKEGVEETVDEPAGARITEIDTKDEAMPGLGPGWSLSAASHYLNSVTP